MWIGIVPVTTIGRIRPLLQTRRSPVAVLSGWEAFPRAERAARRAVALDSGLDLAQSALGFVEYRWHWDAKASFARFAGLLAAMDLPG